MSLGAQAGGGVKSDETLFSILAQLRETDGARVTALADELELAKSTVHDHLATMREYGFVVKCGDTYRLGLEFFNYGHHVRTRYPVYEAAEPLLSELVEWTGEMVWLLGHENGRVMYLDGHAGETDVNANTLIGSWAYMHCNSGGKAILAHLTDDEVAEIIDTHGLPRRTPNTITDPDDLAEELAEIREQGFALNLKEDLEGIHAVAVPLSFDDEVVRGALAIAGPAHRMDRERCETELVDALMAAKNDIELNLVYS